jgi:glutathionylspermidine synthase
VRDLEKTYRDLMNWMVKNPDDVLAARQEIQFKLIKKRFVYGDSTMQTTLMPIFLKRESLEKIRRTSEILDGVIEKVIRLYFDDEYVRSYYPIHFEVPRSWLHSDTGYVRASTINRHDVLFDGKTLKYIEFNTDNPGGKGWTDLLEQLFRQHPLYKDLIDYSADGDRRVLHGIMDALLQANQEAGGPSKPRIALVSFRDLGSRGDEEIVRDFFIEKGLETNLIDPRDLEHRNGGLYSNGVKFDLLLRSLKARYFLNYPRELTDFHRGVMSRAACMVNSWRALLGAEKSVMSFLTNPINHPYFTPEEVKVIKDHVPWTRMFDETVALSPTGEEVSLKAYMLRHREDLVIKPSAGAGGEGVMVGRTTDPVVWKDTINEHIGSPTWVVQEYVAIPQIKLPVIQKNKVVVESKFLNLSPYVFGGKYAGILGRVSAKDVINISAGGGMIPVFPVKEDKGDDTPGVEL